MRDILLVLMGVVVTGVGGFLLVTGVQTRLYFGELGNLPAFSPTDIRDENAGISGYVTGILSEQNQPHANGLVAFTTYQYRGTRTDSDNNRRPIWRDVGSENPALLLNVGGEQVALSAGYRVGVSVNQWYPEGELVEGVSVRYEGFRQGEMVTVLGKVMGDGQVEAESVNAGTFADYQVNTESGSNFALIAGIILLLVGLLVLGIGLYPLFN